MNTDSFAMYMGGVKGLIACPFVPIHISNDGPAFFFSLLFSVRTALAYYFPFRLLL